MKIVSLRDVHRDRVRCSDQPLYDLPMGEPIGLRPSRKREPPVDEDVVLPGESHMQREECKKSLRKRCAAPSVERKPAITIILHGFTRSFFPSYRRAGMDHGEQEEGGGGGGTIGSTLLTRRCRMSVIRDSVQANLARAGGKIIHRLPAHETDRESVRRRILTVNAKHVGRPCRGISCFGSVKKILSRAVLRRPDNRAVAFCWKNSVGDIPRTPMTDIEDTCSRVFNQTIYNNTLGQPISLCA